VAEKVPDLDQNAESLISASLELVLQQSRKALHQDQVSTVRQCGALSLPVLGIHAIFVLIQILCTSD
jgi:hypothetical protein